RTPRSHSPGVRTSRRLPRCRWHRARLHRRTPRAAARRPSCYGKAAIEIRARHDAFQQAGGEDGRMAIESATRLCTLETAVGKIEACPEGACPFWEPGGAALDGRCAFEQLDIEADEQLAAWLLDIRERLASAESTAAADAAHRLFSHLLNESAE